MNIGLLKASLDDYITKVEPFRSNELADTKAPKVARIFREAVTALRAKVPTEVRDADDLPWDVFQKVLVPAGEVLGLLYVKGYNLGAEEVKALTVRKATLDEVDIVTYFNLTDPLAIAYASKEGARMIVEVTETTKEAVRVLIADGLANGKAPRVIAREVRQLVGLTSREAMAVINRGLRLQEEGVKDAVVNRRMAAYEKRLLRERALRVARHETFMSANAGRYRGWEDAEKRGLLPKTTKVVWFTQRDERTCQWCGPLDGTVVALRQEFTVTAKSGPEAKEITLSALHPALHIRCRCGTRLET